MADIWVDVDTALASVPVNIMSLLDDTDFKTRETSVAYNASGMDLVWNFTTTAGTTTQTAVTPTTSGTYDWTNLGDGMYAIEIPASGGASINNDTEGFGWFTGLVTGVLPWRGPIIGFRASGLNDKLVDSAYDTTRGLAGTALPGAAAEASGGLYTRGTGAGQITQSTNGQIDVDAKKINSVATSSVTTINANLGQTQPVNFTGTGGSALVKSDMVDIAGAAVSTTTAQIGVNVVQLSGDGTAADNAESFFDGTGYAGTNNVIPLVTTTTTATNVTTVNGLAANVITAASIATDASAEIAAAVWDEALAGHLSAGSTGEALNAAGAAGDPWITALPGAYGAGTAGHILGTGVPDIAPGAANGLLRGGTNAATSITTALTANIIGNITGNLSGSVGSVTAGVTLAAAAVQAIWDALTSALTTTGSIGKLIVDNLNATITSRMATYTQPTGFLAATFPSGTVANTTNITAGTVTNATNVTNLTNAPTAGDFTATMKTSLNAATPAVTVSDKTGFSLSTAGVDAIWDDAVDGSVTARQSLRLANSANGAEVSGAATATVLIRDLADTKDRITASVDANGNRTAVTLDLS